MTRAESDAVALRRILARIVGDSEDGKVYLAENAPSDLIRNILRALYGAAPRVDPAARETPIRRELHIVCDSLPGPNSCIFIEAEDDAGRSVNCGEWRTRADGLAELVITDLPIAAAKEPT